MENSNEVNKAAAIMDKLANSKLVGAAAGAIGGGMLGSNIKNENGKGTMGAIGGAIVGGAAGALGGKSWGTHAAKTEAEFASLESKLKRVTESAGKAHADLARAEAKTISQAPVERVAKKTPSILDSVKKFIGNKVKQHEKNVAAAEGSKKNMMFNNPYNVKNVPSDMQLVKKRRVAKALNTQAAPTPAPVATMFKLPI